MLRGQALYTPGISTKKLKDAVRIVHRVEDRVVLSVSRGTAKRLEGFEKDPLPVRELEVLLLAARAISNGRTASHLHISRQARSSVTSVTSTLNSAPLPG